ncbi:hypothetical protein [Candidatus Nanosyncoccus nanoralicus]|uniref:Uncharacterized protein n=1 Tax=Candidatus Nanosyncoccus nanoralicus TaxID=2171996 RepID=A0ABY0FJU3_9BACT|nr:hypothetical protein [Candidatus Nanosyncoccus nanoralicus]RYC73236.1 hypothetical protein G3KMM_00496 [Candidatus Nanosyncoccus nanoralicus]
MDQNEQYSQDQQFTQTEPQAPVEQLNPTESQDPAELDQTETQTSAEQFTQTESAAPVSYVDQLAEESGFDTSSYDNTKDLKKPGNPWKIIGIVTSILSVILLLVASFLYFYSNQKIDEGTNLVKQYQKELTESKTVIAEYESATKTKVVDTKDQDEAKTEEKKEQKAEKQIVKWNDLNINFAQLATIVGDDYRITGGRIVTNEDGTKVIAKLNVSKMEKVVDPNGLAMPRYVDHGMAAQTNVYSRKLPSGTWQFVGVYAANGMGVIECKNVSEDMKTAVTVLNKYESDPNMKYSCKTFKDNNPQAGFDTTVF